MKPNSLLLHLAVDLSAWLLTLQQAIGDDELGGEPDNPSP